METIRDAITAVVESNHVPPEQISIIHGDASKGADLIADQLAPEFGARRERFPARWDEYGNSAGHKRNEAMVRTRPDVCLAFIDNESPGATGCAAFAQQFGIPTTIFRTQRDTRTD